MHCFHNRQICSLEVLSFPAQIDFAPPLPQIPLVRKAQPRIKFCQSKKHCHAVDISSLSFYPPTPQIQLFPAPNAPSLPTTPDLAPPEQQAPTCMRPKALGSPLPPLPPPQPPRRQIFNLFEHSALSTLFVRLTGYT